VSDYDVTGAESSDVDSFLGRFQLPYEVIGVYHEKIGLKFGDELTGLWAGSRGMVGDRKPLVHAANVPATYPSTVYEIDPDTQRPKVVTVDGKRQLVVLHAKGEVEKNPDGSTRMRFFKGEARMDEYGNVIYEGERNLIRWWDVCLFDAVYRYSSDINDVKYLRTVPAILVEWINDLLAPIRTSVLDRTLLFYQPLNSLKHIDVLVEDGEDRVIYAAQDLRIDYYVSKQVYEDSGLRQSLTDSAIAAVIKGLDKVVVSRNGLETDIKANAGADVISIRVAGLGGIENDFNVITIKDESARMSVAKTLSMRPDNTISVIDSIKVNFLRHTES
jgi:predicted nucleic acid-binding protein